MRRKVYGHLISSDEAMREKLDVFAAAQLAAK
jgi:hypothetical protein